MFTLPDLRAIIDDPVSQPLPFDLRTAAVGSSDVAFALCVPIILLGLICRVGRTTAASGCTFAFARDGAIPRSQDWGFDHVNARLGVPFNAMMLGMVVQILLRLIYLGSRADFDAFAGSGVMFLTLSYVTPVFVSFCRNR